MKSRLKQLSSLMAVSVLSIVGFVPAADALGITTSGTDCHDANQFYYEGIHNALTYTQYGLKNINTVNEPVLCPIARSPNGSPTFAYVDGTNPSGKSTSCVLQSYDWNNMMAGSQSFTTSATNYDVLVNFTAAQTAAAGYVVANCTLPPNGVIRGFFSGQ